MNQAWTLNKSIKRWRKPQIWPNF